MNRSLFLQQLVIGSGTLAVVPYLSDAHPAFLPKETSIGPLDPQKVKEFVVSGHGDFDKTKKMLLESPSLLYAAWDWGAGDFETGLEGAGHVGNKEIANYLIEIGARPSLFDLTMLGKTQIVKAYLEAYPAYLKPEVHMDLHCCITQL